MEHCLDQNFCEPWGFYSKLSSFFFLTTESVAVVLGRWGVGGGWQWRVIVALT